MTRRTAADILFSHSVTEILPLKLVLSPLISDFFLMHSQVAKVFFLQENMIDCYSDSNCILAKVTIIVIFSRKEASN